MIETPRLRLVPWAERHGPDFIALCADAAVMADLGGPLGADEAHAKRTQYAEAHRRDGFGRWAVETRAGAFLGYAGVMLRAGAHPLGPHADIGWRLARHAWGRHYATEAAGAALADFFRRSAATEVLAYAAPENTRSHAVMGRLGMRRDPARDFTALYGALWWHGLVWVAGRHAGGAAPGQA